MRFFFIIALLLPAIGFSQPIVGIYGGVNSMNFVGDAPDNAKYRSNTGYTLGANLDFEVANDVLLSFQPGISQINVVVAYLNDSTNEYVDSIDLKTNYLVLPVMANIVSDNDKWYFTCGIEAGILMGNKAVSGSEEIDLTPDSNEFSLSLNFGILRKINLGRSFAFVGLRYSQGLTNITNNPINGYAPRIKTSGLQLRFGWQLPIKTESK